MADTKTENLAFRYFGKQMRKERLGRGWSLPELGTRMGEFNDGQGINHGHLSRIERGVRPPTENIAGLCDAVFPERKGWFREYYEESKEWTPPGFRNWAEYEDKAETIRVWSPGVIDGFLQTSDYARALLSTALAATKEVVTARLASRMERQRRILLRDDPPEAWFVVDELSLYRCVGSPTIMAAQMRRLTEVASRPNVTIQILPAAAHPAGASGCMVVGGACYAEHLIGGFVYTDDQTVTTASRLFTTILSESYRASESLRMLEGMAEAWTGGSPLIQTPTAASA